MAKGKYLEWLEPEGLVKLEGWARDGLTDEQVADNIGINRQTLYDWKKKYPDISNALKRGKEVVDRHVENALLKRALGFEYDEKKYITVEMGREEYDDILDAELALFEERNPKATQAERDRFILSIPKTKHVLAEVKTKHVAPDTTAAIFWLKNRKPHEWRDKQEIQHSGTMNHNVADLSALSVEELRKLAELERGD